MKPDMEAVKRFYALQNEWTGVYDGDVTEAHRKNAAIVHRLAGGRLGSLLDLGAGGGQNAAAAADLGYSVVAIRDAMQYLARLVPENAERRGR